MAVTPIRFLKPFLYSGGSGAANVQIKVDRDIMQMHGFVESTIATTLISLGLAATGPTSY